MTAQSPWIRIVACATVLLALALVGSANADPYTWARSSDSETGFRIGSNGRLQPGLNFALAYQSNVYRTEADPEADFTLRLEPHIRYLIRSDNANFKIYGNYYLKKYLGAFVDHDLDQVGHKDLDVFLNYKIGLSLMTRPKSKISFLVADDLHRLSREFDNQDRMFHRYSLMDRLSNNFEIGAEGRPGSSLRIRGLFHFDLTRYTGADTQLLGAAGNRIVYGQAFDLYGTIDAAWRFFPKTQLLFQADVGGILWDPTISELLGDNADPLLSELTQYDSTHWRVWAGIQGKISRKIAMQALFGYGNAYFKDNPEEAEGNLSGANGILGKVQLHWNPVATQRITVGFLRDYKYLYFSNYYITTSPYVRYQGQIAGLVLPRAEFGYQYRQIGGYIDRIDHEVRARVGVDFQIAEVFSIGASYRLWSIVASDGGDDVLFVDHQIGIGLEVGY